MVTRLFSSMFTTTMSASGTRVAAWLLDEGVEQPVLERLQKPQEKELQRCDHHYRGRERLHNLRRFQISALSVAWLRV